MVGEPRVQASESVRQAHTGPPPGRTRELAGIRDVIPLIAGTPTVYLHLQRPPPGRGTAAGCPETGEGADHLHKLQQAERALRAATDIEGLTRHKRGSLLGGH